MSASRSSGRDVAELAHEVVGRLVRRGASVAVAESLTGGLVAGALTSVAGSSAAVRGGVVAYATDVKATVLGVDAALLDRRGPVDADVARQLAAGVARLLTATYGMATTGEAGPESGSGAEVGTVLVAVSGPGVGAVRQLHVEGDREAVRAGAVLGVLALLDEVLAGP